MQTPRLFVLSFSLVNGDDCLTVEVFHKGEKESNDILERFSVVMGERKRGSFINSQLF